VLAVLPERRVVVVDAGHHRQRLHRVDPEPGAPGRDRVRGEGYVEEDPPRIAVDGALEKVPVERRGEELVARRDPPHADVDDIVRQ
jgi:hypothetical protein